MYDIGSIVSISEGAWKQVDGEEFAGRRRSARFLIYQCWGSLSSLYSLRTKSASQRGAVASLMPMDPKNGNCESASPRGRLLPSDNLRPISLQQSKQSKRQFRENFSSFFLRPRV